MIDYQLCRFHRYYLQQRGFIF